MNLRLRRLSPSLVIAALALFVSLGGVSYGVATGSIDSREIKNNTVRTQDIRRSAVRSTDVAANTLTGADLNEARLGKVPAATRADTATNAATVGGVPPSAFARTAQEAPRVLDTPGQPQFQPSFEHSAVTCTSCEPVSFWKDSLGVVHLAGSLSGATSGVAFVLPPGYRPDIRVRVLAVADFAAEATTIVQVRGTGEVELSGAPMGHFTSLDSITFLAER